MKNTSTLFAALAAATFACAATAQENAGSAPEDAVGNEAAVEEISVRDMIDNYLASKGWTEGENTKGSGKFYVATGVGDIQAPLDNRGYIGSRVNAYNKAMLDAKAKMAEYLGVAIASETERTYAEDMNGLDLPAEDMAASEPNQIVDEVKSVATTVAAAASEVDVVLEANPITCKLKRLFVAKLDSVLRAEGIDPDADKAAAEVAAKKILASDQYRKVISSLAKAEITGMQVCCSFEGVPSGKKGQIGVIAIWSPKLQAMAAAMSNGGKLPGGMGKKPIKEQIPGDKAVLMSTFGVQQKIDENGRLVLVSYGQAGAATDSSMSANAAYDKARMNAMSALREFAGETVAVARDSMQAESVEAFEDNSEEYEDQSAFKSKIEAAAAAMNIAGISTVKRWECKHPLAGRMVYGVVCAWSPEQAASAGAMRQSMQNAGSGVSTPAAAKPVVNTAGSIAKQGADADEDAF